MYIKAPGTPTLKSIKQNQQQQQSSSQPRSLVKARASVRSSSPIASKIIIGRDSNPDRPPCNLKPVIYGWSEIILSLSLSFSFSFSSYLLAEFKKINKPPQKFIFDQALKRFNNQWIISFHYFYHQLFVSSSSSIILRTQINLLIVCQRLRFLPFFLFFFLCFKNF